jgi:hypothetical protein
VEEPPEYRVGDRRGEAAISAASVARRTARNAKAPPAVSVHTPSKATAWTCGANFTSLEARSTTFITPLRPRANPSKRHAPAIEAEHRVE